MHNFKIFTLFCFIIWWIWIEFFRPTIFHNDEWSYMWRLGSHLFHESPRSYNLCRLVLQNGMKHSDKFIKKHKRKFIFVFEKKKYLLLAMLDMELLCLRPKKLQYRAYLCCVNKIEDVTNLFYLLILKIKSMQCYVLDYHICKHKANTLSHGLDVSYCIVYFPLS